MKKIKIVLVLSLITLLVIVAFYYIFPGVSFKFLLKAERSIAGLKPNNVTIEGFNIQYLEGGQGDVILLLHGFGAQREDGDVLKGERVSGTMGKS